MAAGFALWGVSFGVFNVFPYQYIGEAAEGIMYSRWFLVFEIGREMMGPGVGRCVRPYPPPPVLSPRAQRPIPSTAAPPRRPIARRPPQQSDIALQSRFPSPSRSGPRPMAGRAGQLRIFGRVRVSTGENQKFK